MKPGRVILSICSIGFAASMLLVCKTEGRVYFKNVKNNDVLINPFNIKMGVTGMKLVPAGEPQEGSGHHHILVDRDPIKKGIIIPSDENHLHFGGGQTEAELNLPPGAHRLTLQFADGVHRSYGPKWAAAVSVTVK